MLEVYSWMILYLYKYKSRGHRLILAGGDCIGGYPACGIVQVVSRGHRSVSAGVVLLMLLAVWVSLAALPVIAAAAALCMPGAVVLACGPAKGV
jgi:hypothetical protein